MSQSHLRKNLAQHQLRREAEVPLAPAPSSPRHKKHGAPTSVPPAFWEYAAGDGNESGVQARPEDSGVTVLKSQQLKDIQRSYLQTKQELEFAGDELDEIDDTLDDMMGDLEKVKNSKSFSAEQQKRKVKELEGGIRRTKEEQVSAKGRFDELTYKLRIQETAVKARMKDLRTE